MWDVGCGVKVCGVWGVGCGVKGCCVCFPLQRLEHLTVCDYYPVLEYRRWVGWGGVESRASYLLSHVSPVCCLQ